MIYGLVTIYSESSVNSVQQLIPMVTINPFAKSGILFISMDLIGLFSLIANMDPFQTVCIKPFNKTNAVKKIPSFWLTVVEVALKEQFHYKVKVWEVERSFNKKRETEKITSIINYHTQKKPAENHPCYLDFLWKNKWQIKSSKNMKHKALTNRFIYYHTKWISMLVIFCTNIHKSAMFIFSKWKLKLL